MGKTARSIPMEIFNFMMVINYMNNELQQKLLMILCHLTQNTKILHCCRRQIKRVGARLIRNINKPKTKDYGYS